MSRIVLVLIVVCVLCAAPVQGQTNDVEMLISQMTLEQKIGQMFMVNLFGPNLTIYGRDILENWQPGAVVLLSSNIKTPQQITQLTNSYQQTIIDAGGIPLFIATDQEGGQVSRLQEGFTTWPVPMLLAALNNTTLVNQVGQGMARELLAVGVNMNLAPIADLQTNIDNPVIGRRSPGSDPELVGETVAALIEGMQEIGVMAVTKHFPGHGATDVDSHLTLPELPFDRERLNNIELLPFQYAIESNTGGMMVAHIWFSGFDFDAPIPSSLSSTIVTDLLRDDLGYDGVILTDALDMDAIDVIYSPEESAIMAINAGIDMIVIGAHVGEATQARVMQAVLDEVLAGGITEARIDESVRRILTAKERFSILDWSPLDTENIAALMDSEFNARMVETLFRYGVTLVSDEYDLLPIKETDRLGIIYPFSRNSIVRECGQYHSDIYWLGISESPSDEDIFNATESLSKLVDKIVVFATDAYDNERQQLLVNNLPVQKLIVVSLNSPYDWLRFPLISTYLVTYSPLAPAIPVACGILFGELVAFGRLVVDLEANLSNLR